MQSFTKKQQGAASIEFVIVFIVFFMLFYGMVSLTFPLLLKATYEELSAEALREAVTLHSFQADPQQTKNAASAVDAVLENTWLPKKWINTCAGYNSYLKISDSVWSVCVGHNELPSILPKITIFGFDIVNLPDEISGEATVSF
jgi:hypothetical protein